MFNKKEQWRNEFVRMTVGVTAGIVVAGLLGKIWPVLTIALAAYLLALALHQAVTQTMKWTRLPQSGAVAMVYTIFLVIVVGVGALLAPFLVRELGQMCGELANTTLAGQWLDDLPVWQANLATLERLFTGFQASVSSLLGLAIGSVPTLLATALLLILSVNFSLELDKFYTRAYWWSQDEKQVQRFKKFLQILASELTGWTVVRVLLMIVVALVSFIGLSLLGVPYPLVWALLTGICTIIPHVGLVLAAIPVMILTGVSLGWWQALAVAIFYVVVYQLDKLIMTPVMRRATSVHPLVSVLLIAAGWMVDGVAGMLLAIPTYLILRIAYSFWVKNLYK